MVGYHTWWVIPLTKWVITPVGSGFTLLIPVISGVIIQLLSGMTHQVWICPISPLKTGQPMVHRSISTDACSKVQGRSTSWRWTWPTVPLGPTSCYLWTSSTWECLGRDGQMTTGVPGVPGAPRAGMPSVFSVQKLEKDSMTLGINRIE